MKPSLFWDIMECRLVVCNSCFKTAYCSSLQWSSSPIDPWGWVQ